MTLRPALVCAAVVALAAPAARADEDAVVRVVADEAQVRTGPGFAFRVIYIAQRGEVVRAVTRATTGHWFQVVLPDGTYGWILGDQVIPLEVDTGANYRKPSVWSRMADAVFSPPPLADGTIGFTFSAGVLGGDGLFLFRPSFLLEPHIAIEALFGETVGEQLDVIYWGAGANVYVFPRSPVTPFVALGGGGAFERPKAGVATLDEAHYKMASAGGGLLVAFKKRVTVRFDFRQHILFDADHTFNAREYSGGLVIVF